MFKTLFGAFFGSYFAYLLALFSRGHVQRLEAYGEAITLSTEYSDLLSTKDKPSAEFRRRA